MLSTGPRRVDSLFLVQCSLARRVTRQRLSSVIRHRLIAMGTLNAVYVRASDPVTAAAVRAAYSVAYSESGTSFFAVDQPDDHFRCPDAEMEALSARLKTDVIWLSFQSAVDAFQYHHWNDGKLVRSLVYGCFEKEREWERVEGTPQPWESGVFFGDLDRALRYRDSEEERREIERIYRGKIIEVGAFEPALEARESARGVAEFFRLPGWSLADGDGG